jgi:manganese/iron transport system permease protein
MWQAALEPFGYGYMVNAILISTLVGATCAFLSAYLMLKGWSLMGDAMAHSIVPGVALSAFFGVPYAAGAFISGILAALGMAAVRTKTKLREDATIGLVFTTFFALGLLIISLKPTSVSVQSLVLGNILSISREESEQVALLSLVCIVLLTLKWKDLALMFFDPLFARSIGLRVDALNIFFLALLSATAVASLQVVGACLVIAMLVTPGSTAYLLTNRFGHLLWISIGIGAFTSMTGAYLSYFLDMPPGGLIVVLQTILFGIVFLFAPQHGYLHSVARPRAQHEVP